MSDWTKLKAMDAVGFVEDVRGVTATGRYYMLATDAGAVPRRGESAEAMHGRTADWVVDRVEMVPVSAHAYQVVVTARPAIAVGSSYVRSGLRQELSVGYEQESFLFSEAVMGLRAIGANPGVDESLAGVDYLSDPEVAGYVPVGLASSGGVPTVMSWSAAADQVPDPCPFVVRPSWSLVGKQLGHDVALVLFFVRAAYVRRYLDWTGVNTGAVSSLPGRLRLPDAGVAGTYAAGGQRLRPLRDDEGRPFYRIERELRRVPPGLDVAGEALRWDANKLGGPMVWQRDEEV